MRIGIIPVISYEKNTFYKVDVRLIDFLKYCFGKKIKIQFLYTKLNTKIDKISKKLKPLGLISASRTGAVAMTRGAKIFN